MTDYISREAALELLKEIEYKESSWNAAGSMICAIRDMPAADVAPVVHAEWKINADGYYPYCSACKKEPPGRCMTAHCPNCGAKMDGGETQEGPDR